MADQVVSTGGIEAAAALLMRPNQERIHEQACLVLLGVCKGPGRAENRAHVVGTRCLSRVGALLLSGNSVEKSAAARCLRAVSGENPTECDKTEVSRGIARAVLADPVATALLTQMESSGSRSALSEHLLATLWCLFETGCPVVRRSFLPIDRQLPHILARIQ